MMDQSEQVYREDDVQIVFSDHATRRYERKQKQTIITLAISMMYLCSVFQ